MSLWWFLPPLVVLTGAFAAWRQLGGIRREDAALREGSRHLAALRPALEQVRRGVDELRANLREQHHR